MWVRLLMCVNILKGFYKCIYLTRCKRSFWIKTNIVHYGWHFWIKVYLTRSEWLFLDRCLLGTMWVTFSDRSSVWDRKELLSEPGSKLLKSPNTAFSDWYPKKKCLGFQLCVILELLARSYFLWFCTGIWNFWQINFLLRATATATLFTYSADLQTCLSQIIPRRHNFEAKAAMQLICTHQLQN